ncbi:MAG: Dabb family protein [Pirellulaceae bacterium]|nr:Dabb family protein [Pirellulaceae bacterium]
MVYFSLKDKSPEACQGLVQACEKYLSGHDGTVYFSAGLRADADRDVNDKEFDVALNLVFESREAHDKYQVAPRHNEFIEGQRENWAKVRVFDSNLHG